MKPKTAQLIRLGVARITASASTRTITGTAVTYGIQASASTGDVIFDAGSIRMSEDLSRVKLLIDHDMRQPVGYLTAAVDTDTEMTCTFHVPESEAGDQALQQASSGLRDGLSVGVWVDPDGYEWTPEYAMHIHSGQLREVSLCAIPAIDDARVTDVAATMKGTTVEPDETTTIEVEATTTPPTVTAAEPPTVTATPSASFVQAATITPPGPGNGLTLTAAMRKAHELIQAGNGGAAVRAALGDVLPAHDAGEGHLRPQWVGELWQATRVVRPIIDAITRAPLTGLKVYGFRREYTDLVAEYAGNKTPIHSGTFKTVPAEAAAKRFAGGNDIDRIYVDLGGAEFLKAWYAAATDDYMLDSEAYVAAGIAAAATKITGATNVVQALGFIGAAAAARAANLSFITFAPDVWQTFINLKESEVPWWLRKQGEIHLGDTTGSAGGLTFAVDPALTGNTLTAGDGRAATFHEAGVPIQIQAENIANGGIDVGVFGYGALLINDPASLFSITLEGEPTPPPPAE